MALVDPDELVELHRPDAEPICLGLDDTLDGGDVLPGFQCVVRDLFPPEA